jgi:hypothetical protein
MHVAADATQARQGRRHPPRPARSSGSAMARATRHFHAGRTGQQQAWAALPRDTARDSGP